ncbi:CDP-glucose 4,6-dehydratase [uncultured Roseobacter sp.]|uniref:CDP-glucose 4,6-dehydratase n=1 Tax=uncultured Roseobacter sp. TaxID=114847 RepID=UPI00262634AF|nr:CDP-glucose 4,6-dehydratase [uncultured Roseobacter sp.]
MDSFYSVDFGQVFAGRRVLVTGHTGFKGGWLSVWLQRLGAHVTGLSLPPDEGPGFFDLCGVEGLVDSRIADIRDADAVHETLRDVDAEIVFHLAAQPLVRYSYRHPAETFATNVSGTAHVLDAAKSMDSLRTVVVITSDKCYDNREWTWGYRENDPLGGTDPYSASKGCTELVANAYANAFFSEPDGPRLATARAGNVFGGGDWGEDRLVPDIVRAAFSGTPLDIRSPSSIRPWQHVMEPLSGYLMLAAALTSQGRNYAGAWNFGPDVSGTVNVRELAGMIQKFWGPEAPKLIFQNEEHSAEPKLHEAGILRLDSTKAQTGLGWKPRLNLPEAINLTTEWYKAQLDGADMLSITRSQIDHYNSLMSETLLSDQVTAAQ